MSLADFVHLAHMHIAAHCPATVRLNGQQYTAGTGGWAGTDPLAAGGAEADRTIHFRLLMSEIDTAGQTVPRSNEFVECLTPTAYAGQYTIDAVDIDPTGTAIVIRCVEIPQ